MGNYTIYTDCRLLVWTFNIKDLKLSNMASYILLIQSSNLFIKKNTIADALSFVQIRVNDTESIQDNSGDIHETVLEYLREYASNAEIFRDQPFPSTDHNQLDELNSANEKHPTLCCMIQKSAASLHKNNAF